MNKRLKPVHPGHILLREFLAELDKQTTDLAPKVFGYEYINDVLDGLADITLPFAKHLSKTFGTTVDYWLNLQRLYDQDKQKEVEEHQERLNKLFSAYYEIMGEDPPQVIAGQPK